MKYLLLNENSFKPNCKFPCVVYVGSYLWHKYINTFDCTFGLTIYRQMDRTIKIIKALALQGHKINWKSYNGWKKTNLSKPVRSDWSQGQFPKFDILVAFINGDSGILLSMYWIMLWDNISILLSIFSPWNFTSRSWYLPSAMISWIKSSL